MKHLLIILCLLVITLSSTCVMALDSTQEAVMNKAISGSSGSLSIKSTSSSTATYTGVKAVRLGITLVIAAFYFLFVAWLAKSQYVAWAEGDINAKEGFGSIVIATLMLLLIVFILTT